MRGPHLFSGNLMDNAAHITLDYDHTSCVAQPYNAHRPCLDVNGMHHEEAHCWALVSIDRPIAYLADTPLSSDAKAKFHGLICSDIICQWTPASRRHRGHAPGRRARTERWAARRLAEGKRARRSQGQAAQSGTKTKERGGRATRDGCDPGGATYACARVRWGGGLNKSPPPSARSGQFGPRTAVTQSADPYAKWSDCDAKPRRRLRWPATCATSERADMP